MTAVSDGQKLLSLCSDYVACCATKKGRIDFRQMQASVSFAAIGCGAYRAFWSGMPGSSSPEVTRNIMILRIKSEKKKYIYIKELQS